MIIRAVFSFLRLYQYRHIKNIIYDSKILPKTRNIFLPTFPQKSPEVNIQIQTSNANSEHIDWSKLSTPWGQRTLQEVDLQHVIFLLHLNRPHIHSHPCQYTGDTHSHTWRHVFDLPHTQPPATTDHHHHHHHYIVTWGRVKSQRSTRVKHLPGARVGAALEKACSDKATKYQSPPVGVRQRSVGRVLLHTVRFSPLTQHLTPALTWKRLKGDSQGMFEHHVKKTKPSSEHW